MTKLTRINILFVALLFCELAGPLDHALAAGGVPLWTNYSAVCPCVLNNEHHSDLLTTDHDNSVIVTGTSYSPAVDDYCTVKISSSGISLWTNRFGSPGNLKDQAMAVAVDSNNNVFVTGYATYSATDEDFVTIKYSSSGTPMWTNRYNGPAGSFDEATAMAVDSGDNVIVTGSSRGTGGNNEWATVKYSNSGALQWVQRYGDPGSSDAWPVSVALDGTNVYVAGYNATGEFATIAYSYSLGTPLWTNNYGPGYFVSRALDVATDQSGHVFVTGFAAKMSVPPFDEDFVTLAYASDGVPLWTNRYVGLGLSFDNDDRAVGMVVRNDKVFVLGSSMGADSMQDFATVAYSTSGALLWPNRFSGNWGHDQPSGIAADQDGNVFVTGLRGDAGLNSSFCVTLGYTGTGYLLWGREILYDLISPTDIAADSSGNVLVTGYGNAGGVTIKYSYTPPPPILGFQWANNQLVMSWTNAACALQSSANPAGPYVDVPGATSPYTNSTAGPPMFFRLSCN